MAERRNNQRRRGGMRFKPSTGISGAKAFRSGQKARTQADSVPSTQEEIFNTLKHEHEIKRAENKAAGLSPDADVESSKALRSAELAEQSKSSKSRGRSQRRGRGNEKTFERVEIPEEPAKNLAEKVQKTAKRIVNKVKAIVRPRVPSHKEVIVNAESLETRVAVIVKGKLEDFTIERTDDVRMVGSIYKGRIKNLEDGLRAAFVDIGYEKNAFLHYWDIIPNELDSSIDVVERGRKRDKPRIVNKDIPKKFPVGTDLLVQVTKGPIGTKGPRVTTNIALPGRYLVLLPNSDQSGVSRKIEDREERKRLKTIVRELDIPDGMGVIIRTVGKEQKKRYFIRDLALLLQNWEEIRERVEGKKSGFCVFQEPDLIDRTVRDFLTDDVERIVVDSGKAAERIKEYIGSISKRSVDKVQRFPHSEPIFNRFGITRQLDSAFSRQVWLPSGGYIIFDETEALVAIDVNTGSHKKTKEQESTITKVNLEAAEEICCQLRLRNIGGLIVLDFIDMKSRRDKQQVFQRMKEGLKNDKSKTHILPISDLGLMEMTRQRHSESVRESVYVDCGNCRGRGKVKSPLTMSVEIQRKLGEILKRRQDSRKQEEVDFKLRVSVPPSVLNRLRHEDEELFIEMEKKFYGKISFRADTDLHQEEFKVFDALTNKELAGTKNARR